MEYDQALALAREAVEILRPSCERVEIAGGVRRHKLQPHDIELVAVPKIEVRSGELEIQTLDGWKDLGEVSVNLLNGHVTNLLRAKILDLGDRVTQHRGDKEFTIAAPFNEKYKRLKFHGEQLDLFIVTPPAQWGVEFVLRTGDMGFSHWIVQQGYPRGIHFGGSGKKSEKGSLWRHVDQKGRYIANGTHPHFEGSDFCRWELIPTPEETDVFKALGLEWRPPELRVTTETTKEEWEEATHAPEV